MSSPIAGTDSAPGGPLQTKYYCKLDKTTMNMNVVMELKPTSNESNERLPLRYVLLIDVSHSMTGQCGQQNMSLLQRVKMFAELAVRKMDVNDWLSIVSFATQASVDFDMQRMLPSNKLLARNIIQSLSSRDETNLESGLMTALQAIQRAPKTHRPCRDCIILFTDGVANHGDIDAQSLIRKYKSFQTMMNRKSEIPVSALTLGGYHPSLLEEVAHELGSESFYWLNDEADFEAEMLMPLFLREKTHISDVNITINSRLNCYFHPVDYEAKHFRGLTVSKIKVKHKKKSKKMKLPTTESFFIHSLPDTLSKHLTFNLQVSELQDLDSQRVVEITVQYLDLNLETRHIQDYILLSTVSLKTSLLQDPKAANTPIANDAVLLNFSAYTVVHNHINISWSDAEHTIVKVTEEKFRHVSAAIIEDVKRYVENDPDETQRLLQQACADLNEIRVAVAQILGSVGVSKIDSIYKKWTEQLIHVRNTVARTDARNYAILCAMKSSIDSESPIGGGVFQGQQPFMNDTMQQKLDEEKNNLQAIRRLRSKGDIDINEVKIKARSAIAAGYIKIMESCYEDLRALELFGMGDQEYRLYIVAEISHRRELENAKKDLEVAVRNEDIGAATEAMTKLENLRSTRDLTFTKGDEEAVAQGHNAVETLRLKRSMRGEIAKQRSIMKLPTSPQNMAAIASAIQALTNLRKRSAHFNDVFTSQHDAELNAYIDKYQLAISRIQELKEKMEELVSVLSFPRRSVNYEAIKVAIVEMEEIKAEARENYEGLYTEKEDKALQQGIASKEILTAEKERISERLTVLIPILELPMIPRNYSALKDTVEEVTTLRNKSNGFRGVFTDADEVILTKASSNLAILITKRDELLEKVSLHIRNAGLPKLPTNYDKIKNAVNTLTVVKQEANGFEDVFTTEHDVILQRGHASLQILEAEKEEFEKEEKECVPQLQLPMISNNFNEISKGVATMQRISTDLKGFGLYKDEYDGILNQAVFNRDVLDEKKQQIMKDIQMLKVDLKVPLIPDNLPTLNVAVDRMKALKIEADGYGNIFTNENEADLYQASIDLGQLTKNTEKTTKARHRLEEAMEAKHFIRLSHALKKASRAPFIKDDELLEARKLTAFLNPENRIAAVETAIEEEDIEMIEEALLDLKEARVLNHTLEETAAIAIKRLRREKRRRERQIRREQRAAARRKKALEKLSSSLEAALTARDLDLLEKAVNDLDVSDFVDEEVEAASEAREVLKILRRERMRERLKEGIESKDMETLYNALMDAKYGKYEEFMQKEYDEAEALLMHILELMRLREAVSKMSRSTISEVHSYGAPPIAVINVMRAVFVLLGENPKQLTWVNIQGLLGTLGRNSMTKRVKRFRIKSLSNDSAKVAAKCLGDLELEDVEAVSKMAATLFAWAKYIVKELEHTQEEQEKRKAANAERADGDQYEDEDFERETVGSTSEEDVVSEDNINGKNSPEVESDGDDDNDNKMSSEDKDLFS